MIEREAAVFVVDRHDAAVEPPFLDRAVGILLAEQRECVGVLAGDAFKCGNRIGADALGRLRVNGAQAQVADVHHPGAVAALGGDIGHHLHAARDDQVLDPGHDRGRRHVDAADPAAAEPREGDARGPHIVPGIERRHPANVVALLARLVGGAPDHVIDFGGVEIVALPDRLQHGGGEMLRVHMRQRAARPACRSRAGCGRRR